MSILLRFIACLMLLAVLLAGFAFSGYNSLEVPLWLGVELAPQKVGVWVALAFTCGGLVGLVLGFGLFRRIKYKVKISQLQSRLNQAKKEIENLQGSAGSAVKIKASK